MRSTSCGNCTDITQMGSLRREYLCNGSCGSAAEKCPRCNDWGTYWNSVDIMYCECRKGVDLYERDHAEPTSEEEVLAAVSAMFKVVKSTT